VREVNGIKKYLNRDIQDCKTTLKRQKQHNGKNAKQVIGGEFTWKEKNVAEGKREY
jgi:hypothetical protein